MKKSILFLLIITIMLSSFPVFSELTNETDIAMLLSELDIMKGDPNGDLRLQDAVSRAEFTKLAVASSAYRDSVATSLTISPFKDVLHTHWAAPYIQLAVSKNLCKGYPDASFNPDGTVLYEEAVTMLLKVLGYTDSDFGISWPYGQVGLAKKIGLCDGIEKNVGDTLNREDVMVMIYNLLNTKAKGTNQNMIALLHYEIKEDTILIATAKEDSSVGSDKVFTSAGAFKMGNLFNYEYVGKKGDLVVKNSDELVCFIPSGQMIKEYNIYQVLGEDVIVLENGQMKKLDADNSLALYHKSAKTTLKNQLAAITPGDVITTYQNENGVYDYGVLRTDELQGPYTVQAPNWAEEIGLSSGITVMRDGVKATADKIAVSDILYYSKALGIVWGYSSKVTGVYEKALPNKDMPTSVVISGVTYQIEGVSAFNKLSSNGSCQYGDTVTLLMGRTNQIADVINPGTTTRELYGYVFATGKKELIKSDNTKYIQPYIKVALPDGNAYEYISDKDYENLKNAVVRITFSNGTARAASISPQSVIEGNFNWSTKKLGNHSLASEVNIIDISTLNPIDGGHFAKVFPQRIDGISIARQQIHYAGKNAAGEIDTLILYNVTGDAFTYGVVTKAEKTIAGMPSSYTIDVGGKTTTIQSTTIFSISSGQPCRISYTGNGSLSTMQGLTKIEDFVTSVTESYLIAGNGKYMLSDRVLVYERTFDYNYQLLPLRDLIGSNGYHITAYYDKPIASGGRVRILIANKK